MKVPERFRWKPTPFRWEPIRPPRVGKFGRVYKYILREDYRIALPIQGAVTDQKFIGLTKDGILTIRGPVVLPLQPGYAWDGPSGPALDTVNFMRASCVHDALYQLIRDGVLTMRHRKVADKILRKIAREDGMSRWRAWKVYLSLRLVGRGSAKPK